MTVGLWFIGARGSIATTTYVGLFALQRRLMDAKGLVTGQQPFASLDLAHPGDVIAVGGHDMSDLPLVMAAEQLEAGGVLPSGMFDTTHLADVESRLRPGVTGEHPKADLQRAADDMRSFRQACNADRVVVINVSSTEPALVDDTAHVSWPALHAAVEAGQRVLGPSSLYAMAALEAGCAYVDFTPSAGARLPALQERAGEVGVPLAGNDGKTGETLLKSVLAPMFAMRNLRVRSWSGTNLLGGGDGASLADPERKQAKVDSKGRSLDAILGYETEHPVHIDHVPSMGQWKTAWDHIAFEGFFGTRMSMQFTWEGCDSALAAPLVIDLARLVDLAWRRGERGPVSELGFFFKDPMATDVHDLSRQYETLCRWATGQ